jgi:hypothetical protein
MAGVTGKLSQNVGLGVDSDHFRGLARGPSRLIGRNAQNPAAGESRSPMDTGPTTAIELRVDDVGQLFDTLDPFPFRERDLDRHAEEYIVGWARELPLDQPIVIIIHLPPEKASEKTAEDVRQSFSHYFDYRAGIVRRDLNELFRIGRRSLAIGTLVLVVSIGTAQIVVGMGLNETIARLVEESSVILGWVANWRPFEIFLYDWWPIWRRLRLYRRLAEAEVRISPAGQG